MFQEVVLQRTPEIHVTNAFEVSSVERSDYEFVVLYVSFLYVSVLFYIFVFMVDQCVRYV